MPVIQRVQATVNAQLIHWNAEAARLEKEKRVIYKVFNSGRRDLDAERKRREQIDHDHGQAKSRADSCGKFLQRIDQVLQR